MHYLLQTGTWGLHISMGVTPVRIRRVPALKAVAADSARKRESLARLEAARQGYRERIKKPLGAPVSPTLVGAAQIFRALGRLPEAVATRDLLFHNAAFMKRGWGAFGSAQLRMGHIDEAIQALETCSKLWKEDP
jgi:hypothetical protein